MPNNICSLTHQPITQAAISKTTGHIYQKSAIIKHLSSFPYCPITNQPMQVDDLVFVQGTSDEKQRAEQSVATVLSTLKEEYDTLVLERFYLKKSIHQTKTQLAHSLTANHASEKVIAKLIKENQSLDNELVKLQAQLNL